MAAGRVFGEGIELVAEDFNNISPALERQSLRLAHFLSSRTNDGFFADSFKVSFINAYQILVKSGLGIQFDTTQVPPEPRLRQVRLEADTQLTISPANASQNRIDILVVKNGVADSITGTRNFKDATTGTISAQTVVLEREWAAQMSIVAGTPAASPVAPAVPAGYIKVATMLITANSGMLNASAITDNRTIMPVGPYSSVLTTGFGRLTQGAAVLVSQLLADTDQLLKYMRPYYMDFDQLDTSGTFAQSEPAAPPAGQIRVFMRDGQLWVKYSNSRVHQVNAESIVAWDATMGFINVTAQDLNKTYMVDSTKGYVAVSFPTAPPAGFRFKVMDVGGVLGQPDPVFGFKNFGSILPTGVKIQGTANMGYQMFAPYGSWAFVYDGTQWFVL